MNSSTLKKEKKEKSPKKVAKKKAKKVVQKALSRNTTLVAHSAYLETILDPANKWGAKIPDPDTSLSFVSHCKQTVQVTANAAGVAGMCVMIGWIGNTATYFDYYVTTAGATSAVLAWQGGTKTYATPLAAVATRSRPVSALLSVISNATSLKNSGRYINLFLPGPFFQVAPAPNNILGSSITILSYPFNTTVPVSKAFAEVRYLPTDARTTCYNQGSGNPSFYDQTSATGLQYGCLVIVADGLDVGTIQEFTWYENIESIPASNTSNFTVPTSPSKSDPFEQSTVSNFLADKPTLSVTQPSNAEAAGTAVTSKLPLVHAPTQGSDEPTFMEKIMTGVEKYGPMVGKAAGLLAAVI